VRLVVMV